MMIRQVRSLAFLSIGVLLLGGSPEQLSPLPAPASAAQRIVCASANYGYSYCPIDARRGVQLSRQLSNAPCARGRSWGNDREGVWVDRGCAAEFSVGSSGGSNAGAIVGAAIIGGIVGALLGGGSNHPDDDRGHHYRDPTPPPYDRYGNPNYDRKGRYTGCHGLGCMVDNPDVHDRSQDIDPTPQFDKDGNPNFDTHGNYIGAHGLGSLVDNPDTTSDNSPDTSPDDSNPNP